MLTKDFVVFTNGCFDMLHAGHIHSITEINRVFNGCKLVIGINCDSGVTKLKGKSRPIIEQEVRKNMLLAIKGVDEVHIFYEDTPDDLIKYIKPNIIVKGEDYYMKDVTGVNTCSCGIFLQKHLAGFSTTALIQKIKEA